MPPQPPPQEPSTADWAMRLLDGFDLAIVVCDERGVVRQVSAEARRLAPGVAEGGSLADSAVPELAAAAARGQAAFEASAGGRALVGRRRQLGGGWTAWHLRDVTARRARDDAMLAERARSRFLARASRQLGLSLNPTRTARTVVELAAELGHAATVVLPTGEYVHGVRGATPQVGRWTSEQLPPALVEAMDGTAGGVERHHAAHFGAHRHVDLSRAVEAVTVPLRGAEAPGPALVLWLSGEAQAVEDPDGEVLEEFATRAGTALAAARAHAEQARTAAVLKRGLLPAPLPDVPGLAFGAEYRPATGVGSLGGDFYEVVPSGAGASFVFGDVVGTGVEAAVTSGVVRQALGALRRVPVEPRRALEVLNSSLLDNAPVDRRWFVTAVLGDAEVGVDGGIRLELTGGGHLSPLVLRRDGRAEFVKVGGMLVGALPAASFRTVEVDLRPGEVCVFYSDGVTEARGGADGAELFGAERLAALLTGCHVMPPTAVAQRVVLGAQEWLAGREHDDIAVLALRAAA
ncbi:PP2C family protein-serine/threonine phosphatase [Saccharothrix coeruleofusca]|uniref:PP2C family protein-serine/threonine phosphatase n=1 Tax=Saccharothrix coeruleofusca TaxID=33919 RepID=UPI00167130A8|nr:PP2C family protein-serine/threonine phosphatase [Saccharothrix coeruleofusca]